MEEYTKRDLSYESDALHAFLGVLNSWSTLVDAVGCNAQQYRAHIWGLAIHGSWLNLGWHHEQPTLRRAGFPSWSWVGWQGPVNIWRSRYPEITFSVEVSYSSSSEIVSGLTHPDAMAESWVPLDKYFHDLQSMQRTTKSALRLLKITGPCPRLRLFQYNYENCQALIPATIDRSIRCTVDWDDSTIQYSEYGSCIAIMIETGLDKTHPSPRSSPGIYASGGQFLLLMPTSNKGVYKRVGRMSTSWLPISPDYSVGTPHDPWEEPFCEERTVLLE